MHWEWNRHSPLGSPQEVVPTSQYDVLIASSNDALPSSFLPHIPSHIELKAQLDTISDIQKKTLLYQQDDTAVH